MQINTWKSAALTDVGTVRKVNEDNYLNAPEVKLWCVADGMGGHAKGDVASKMIVDHLRGLVTPGRQPLSTNQIEDCLQTVNQHLFNMSVDQNSIIGSTVVVLILDEQRAHCIWAGDSRIYRLRQNRLTRLTRDHSQVEDMVQAGMLTPEEAENHPNANVITRAVGASDVLELDVVSDILHPDDKFFLCSDGLNKVMEDAEIERALISMPINTLTQTLIETSLERKARDNVTIIAVNNEHKMDDTQPNLRPMRGSLDLDDTLPLNNR